jgi:uncharacterized protein (TIGR02118 family)
MIVRMGLLKKKPEWRGEDFRHHWRERHGALAAKLPGLRRYEQNHVIDSEQRGFAYPRGPEQLDGFSMLWFDDVHAMRDALNTDPGRALIADEEQFIGDLRILRLDTVEVIAPSTSASTSPSTSATGRPPLKRMSLLRRLPEVSPERFMQEWRVEHAHLVKRVQGVRGYRQNLVTGREVPKGNPVAYDGLPVDGIVELWFDDAAAIDAAFSSPQGKTLMSHAREFIGEISTFLVDCHVVTR